MSVTIKSTVTYEYSTTRQLYSPNGNIIEDGRYYGFAYYGWKFYENASNWNRMFERAGKEITDETMIDFILNSLGVDPLNPRVAHGGLRIRKVTETVTTISEKDDAGNFYEEKSNSKRAQVIFERMVTKEEADAKAEQLIALEAEDALIDARIAERERVLQEEEAAAKASQRLEQPVEKDEVPSETSKKGMFSRLFSR